MSGLVDRDCMTNASDHRWPLWRYGAALCSSGDYTFRWSRANADAGELFYAVEYSADDGATYQPLTDFTTESKLTYPLKHLPGSLTARLRVTVSDGFQSSIAVSGRFSRTDRPFVDLQGDSRYERSFCGWTVWVAIHQIDSSPSDTGTVLKVVVPSPS